MMTELYSRNLGFLHTLHQRQHESVLGTILYDSATVRSGKCTIPKLLISDNLIQLNYW